MSATRRDDRWQHLVTAAALVQTLGQPRDLLDSALEVFPASLDPIEDFEGFAVRRFLLALRTSLESE